MIQLRKSGLEVNQSDIEHLRKEFREKHCVLLHGLLEPDLLTFVDRRLELGPWQKKAHEDIALELTLDDELTLNLLSFLSNTPHFLQLASEISAIGPITSFKGRVYRMMPNSGHFSSWHNDATDGRVLGMSLNLSRHAYKGGIFQLRERQSRRLLNEVANTGWGDATLFRISKELEHQVTNVVGDELKMAFAGWFQSGPPNFLMSMRQVFRQQH